MHPVLREVGRHHQHRELDHAGHTSDPLLHRGNGRPVEQHHRRFQREDRRELHQQRADEEIGEIGAPARSKDALLRQPRKQPLERNEDHRVDDQVQQEPIETQEGPAAELVFHRHSGSAEERGGERAHDADGAEHLVAAQREARDAKHEGRDQHEMKQAAHPGHRVERPCLRRSEEFREMKAEHRAETQQSERRRQDAAHPAGPKSSRLDRAQGEHRPSTSRGYKQRRHGPANSSRTQLQCDSPSLAHSCASYGVTSP